jgi:polar amino acid transport system ATP-binding protein
MLELKNISKAYGDRVIFDHFNLTIPEHEILAIVGPSGGGKTTLLRMMAGLETIDSGQVVYNDQVLSTEDLVNKNLVGFVFQDFQLFPHLTVLDNLTLSPIKTAGVSKADAEAKAMKLLKDLQVDQQADAYPFSLSGGQKQRVALARAMMVDPEIIGYDEPTSALDPELRDQVADLILANKASGVTQIVVTHDMDFAEKIADNILKVNPRA